MQNQYLAEHSVLKLQGPVDANGGVTGDRINLDVSSRIAIVIQLGSSAASTVEATLRQHDAAAAGNSKDLEVANKYYYKAGAALSFTKVEPTANAALYDLSAEFSTDGGILVLEVAGEDLDVNGGFNHVSVDLASSGVAKDVAILHVGHASFKKPAFEVEA
jgi:hypothetical protein